MAFCPRCSHIIGSSQSDTVGSPSDSLESSTRLADSWITFASIACLAAGVLSIRFFWEAHSFLDRSSPRTSPAVGYHAAILLLTIASGVLGLRILKRGKFAGYAALVAVPVALFAAIFGTTYYSDEDPTAAFLTILTVFALLFALGLALYVLAALVIYAIVRIVKHVAEPPSPLSAQERRLRKLSRLKASFIVGWGIAAGHALASLYILVTLPRQIESAKAAHETPAIGVPLLAIGLLVLAAFRWRR